MQLLTRDWDTIFLVLSNAACIANVPFAYLIFGINDDDHNVCNTSYKFKSRKEGNQELEFWLRRLINPSIMFQHFECHYDDSIRLEILKIPTAKGEPTTFKNVSFIRFNSSITKLKDFPDYSRTIYNSEIDWSAEIIPNATLENLDVGAVDFARQKFKENSANKPYFDQIDDWTAEVLLDKAKITIAGGITNTALILLGESESSHLISPSIAEVTWKLDTEEKAYEHFTMPLLLSTNKILKRIRNVKYKFFPNNQLIATEVMKYDPESILEALNNCIAHQDYSRNERILLTEKVSKLLFYNAGSFYDGNVEEYSLGTKTPKKYRNKWLANAMVNLSMIDSLGYGIHKMYLSQKKRYFPLPDYAQSTTDTVVLELFGHAIDENYSKLLIEQKDEIDLTEVILLDKVQKNKPISTQAAKVLRKKGLIEGRKPNYYLAADIAKITDEKANYIKNRGFQRRPLQKNGH